MESSSIYNKLIDHISKLVTQQANKRTIVAIDGRCGAGKTTLANYLQEKTGAMVFRMDDYFLRPEQRTAQRLDIPGENVDHERFGAEILKPLLAGAEEVSYQRFNCQTQSLEEKIQVKPGKLCIVEGSYSCHPALMSMYDYRIFMTVSPEEQMKRILRRNGPLGAKIFEARWIPLEEKYFSMCAIEEHCDCTLDTTTIQN